MALESMTGYGSGQAANAHLRVRVELRSVNHKHLEVQCRLPAHYVRQELDIRHLLQPLQRGKVYVLLSVEALSAEAQQRMGGLNLSALRATWAQLNALATELKLPSPSLADLLAAPQNQTEVPTEVEDEEAQLVRSALLVALKELQAHRLREGQALKQEFLLGLDELEKLTARVPPLEPRRVEALRSKMEAGLAEMGQAANSERFQQELFFYLEKYDIREEQARLKVHLREFRRSLDDTPSNGRRLQFVLQELWREVTTLGNKAYSIDIQSVVVRMKEELEKIKEQLNNIV